MSDKYHFKLIAMGDIRQLPSINIGDIFYRIKLCREYFNYNELTKIIRSTNELLISVDDILDGKLPRVNKSFKFVKVDMFNNFDIKPIILNNYNLENSIIITMTNQSVDKYTKIIRDVLNPLDKINDKFIIKEIEYNYNIYRIGDPVVHTKNFNNEGLYNGMTGKIIEINLIKESDNFQVLVLFNTGLTYKYNTIKATDNKFKYLKPSYIITVHKSQGQEYENVFVIIDNLRMANLNLLYTAITRGKEYVTIISTSSLLKKCINNICVRNSLLDYMITFKLTYNTEEHNIEHFKTYYNFISEYDEIIYKKNKYKIDRLCNIYKDNDIIGKYDIELNKVKLN
jgi:exodeoxyribonuclease V alpha subunit